MIEQIIAYEQGDLDADATVDLFAALVKNGTAWSLQGHYGRTAQALIDHGYIDPDGTVLKYLED
jgi:hypothetical protein